MFWRGMLPRLRLPAHARWAALPRRRPNDGRARLQPGGLVTGDWERLLAFLRGLWELPSVQLTREPVRVTGGYGRRSWLLELTSPSWPEPRRFQLRCSDPGKASLRLEVERLRWLTARGYPVSPPMLWVENVDVVGEPFALLEWVPGRTLAEQIRSGDWRPDSSEGHTIGLLLARLHALSPEGFPAEAISGSWVPPIDQLAPLLGPVRLDALRRWLERHHVQSSVRVVCHLDLHPLNVVMSAGGPVVIDWEMARIDEPLLDVAISQVHTEVALGIGEYPQMGDRFAPGRSVLDAYRALRPAPGADLGYFRVVAACRQLGDVAGALQRPVLREEDHAELEAEGASAVSILDREIRFTG
jgi:aminoglycoside phosphotransferase (APT) family kinase protein